MIGLALGGLPLAVLYPYVEESLVNRSRDGPTAPIAASALREGGQRGTGRSERGREE